MVTAKDSGLIHHPYKGSPVGFLPRATRAWVWARNGVMSACEEQCWGHVVHRVVPTSLLLLAEGILDYYLPWTQSIMRNQT